MAPLPLAGSRSGRGGPRPVDCTGEVRARPWGEGRAIQREEVWINDVANQDDRRAGAPTPPQRRSPLRLGPRPLSACSGPSLPFSFCPCRAGTSVLLLIMDSA